jgi:desulfoferrodoxin-like iron-binding protein
MATAGEIYKCELCGNGVFVMEGGDGDLKAEPATWSAAVRK